MRPHPLSAALGLAFGLAAVPPALSAGPLVDPAARDHDRVVVTATRTERLILDVPNTVDVIDRGRMDELLVRDVADLFRYEPGITVTRGFGRFGIGDIRVRGLGGNRVRILTDGVPVSDAFSIGSFSSANRNFVDPDTLKRVEVVRGPTSSLYGSDALGGVVAFITKDPSDYLEDGRSSHLGLRLGAESDRDGFGASATGAFGGGRWSGLVNVGHRQGRETGNRGSDDSIGAARTRPNPQRSDGRSLLSRLVFAPTAGQRFRLTVEGNEDSADTDMLTSRGLQAMTGATNTLVLARDHQTRARVSFAHELDSPVAGFADALDWQVYRQDSETTQDTLEERITGAGAPERRERSFNFDQRSHGLQANALKQFSTGNAEHALTWGLDLQRTDTRQKRDGRVTDLLTGASSNAMLPDVFPVRDFPVSRTDTAALYAQDEIVLAGGAFRLVPALRLDRYELKPEADPIFTGDNPGVPLSGLTHTQASPKLGMVWRFQPDWSLFASYAHGFRAPPYNDVNIGFTNTMFGYTAIPNPDLRPETSRGFEAGIRHTGRALHASMTGYHNRYEDFIESMRFIGFNDEGLMVYQSQNVAEARIYGAELKAGVELGALLSPAWKGWSVQGAAAWSRGDDRTAHVPLDSIDPLTATLGIAYATGTWGAELIGRAADARSRVSSDTLFQAPGHAVLDLYAHWQLSPQLRLDAGIRNLADRKYWGAGNLPQALAGTSNTVDRYTAPGRSFALSLAVAF
ncbi:TonB-dependent hemoglobin/transferrin/lactoferrin family receptor [Lysobacter sp. GX 14042]|uniref:TonB-dependent hemoglobin/transferrin/lactoferrin family receptor n=1 Tax=Lysobacter sp. GX 14042 TaxID=2907155 RepID=UPI001F418C95|nr:TonB-dependent hemoglobin/transferrin/lactoferrin family receptor [Lysobacter sp. GX 14042]MCE7032633.1 TonB-dependent hemoglobin/transferrin/lactoferrin family receptor [Lysobacter sp. GX 14042]